MGKKITKTIEKLTYKTKDSETGIYTEHVITAKERAKVLYEYVNTGTYIAASRKCGIPQRMVKRIVESDPDILAKYQKKREEEAKHLYGALSAKSKKFMQFCDAYFDELCNPAMVKRLAATDMEKLTKIFAINLDKFVLLNKAQMESGAAADNTLNITITRKAVDAIVEE